MQANQTAVWIVLMMWFVASCVCNGKRARDLSCAELIYNTDIYVDVAGTRCTKQPASCSIADTNCFIFLLVSIWPKWRAHTHAQDPSLSTETQATFSFPSRHCRRWHSLLIHFLGNKDLHTKWKCVFAAFVVSSLSQTPFRWWVFGILDACHRLFKIELMLLSRVMARDTDTLLWEWVSEETKHLWGWVTWDVNEYMRWLCECVWFVCVNLFAEKTWFVWNKKNQHLGHSGHGGVFLL